MVLTNVRYRVRISLEKIYHFSSNGSHSMETFNWDREIGPKDHIWDSTQLRQGKWTQTETIGFNTVGTGKPDPKTIYGQRPYMGFNTVRQGNRTQRQLDLTQLGQGNQTQRPYMGKDHIYMGFNTVGQGNQTQTKDHIWAKTIMGFNTVGQGNRTQRQLDLTQLGQGNRTQRPYMGKDHIWDSTQWDKETGPKDSWI